MNVSSADHRVASVGHGYPSKGALGGPILVIGSRPPGVRDRHLNLNRLPSEPVRLPHLDPMLSGQRVALVPETEWRLGRGVVLTTRDVNLFFSDPSHAEAVPQAMVGVRAAPESWPARGFPP